MHGLLLAQALVEHGLLSSMAAGVAQARYQVEAYLGPNGPTYLLVGAVAIFLVLLGRRRR